MFKYVFLLNISSRVPMLARNTVNIDTIKEQTKGFPLSFKIPTTANVPIIIGVDLMNMNGRIRCLPIKNFETGE